MDKDRQAPPRKARVQTRLPEQMSSLMRAGEKSSNMERAAGSHGWASMRPQSPREPHYPRGICIRWWYLLHGPHQMFPRRTGGRQRTRESPSRGGRRGEQQPCGEDTASPRISSPSPRSTEAPSTGDKMENPVTLTAPAETQSWEGREEEENPSPSRAQIIRELLPLAGDRIIPKAPSMKLRGTALA